MKGSVNFSNCSSVTALISCCFKSQFLVRLGRGMKWNTYAVLLVQQIKIKLISEQRATTTHKLSSWYLLPGQHIWLGKYFFFFFFFLLIILWLTSPTKKKRQTNQNNNKPHERNTHIFYHIEEFHFLENILVLDVSNKNKGNSELVSINKAGINGHASVSPSCGCKIY